MNDPIDPVPLLEAAGVTAIIGGLSVLAWPYGVIAIGVVLLAVARRIHIEDRDG